MPRAIWTGSLSFGLVNIPIEVHTAVRDQRPHFRMLHAKDRSPINFERICQKDGKSVAWNDIVKGYEYEKGHFVVLDKEDFAAAALEKTRRIDVLDFVEAQAIDDRYFDKPYYLEPQKGGERAYALMREALAHSGKVGIAKVVLKSREHLAAVKPVGKMLMLGMMRFAHEIVDPKGLDLPDAIVPQGKEMDLARTLIDSMTDTFDPAKYKDDYHDKVLAVIQAKVEGVAPQVGAVAAKTPGKVVDLMEVLKQSLAETQKKEPVGPRSRKAR